MNVWTSHDGPKTKTTFQQCQRSVKIRSWSDGK